MFCLKYFRKTAYRLSAFWLALIIFLLSLPVSASSLSAEETDAAEHTLYAGPTENSTALCSFYDDDAVTLLEYIDADWARIRLTDGTIGCCDRSLLGLPAIEIEDEETIPYITKTNTAVQVISSPEESAPAVSVLAANVRVTCIGRSEGDYRLVRLPNGTLGYIHESALTDFYERPAIVRSVPVLTADTGVTTEEEAAARLMALSAYFEDSRYWNCCGTGLTKSSDNLFCISDTPCDHTLRGYVGCNIYSSGMNEALGYGSGTQCLGYVGLLSDLTFGTDAPITVHNDWDRVRVGDHIRLVLWDHSMLVTEVGQDEDGSTYFYVTEVNADYETCQISWGRKFTKADLRRLGDYIRVFTRYTD